MCSSDLALMVSCILVVIGFKNSSALGAAYGIAVTGTMAITTLLFVVVAAARWNWPRWQALTLAAACVGMTLFAFLYETRVFVEMLPFLVLAAALGAGAPAAPPAEPS